MKFSKAGVWTLACAILMPFAAIPEVQPCRDDPFLAAGLESHGPEFAQWMFTGQAPYNVLYKQRPILKKPSTNTVFHPVVGMKDKVLVETVHDRGGEALPLQVAVYASQEISKQIDFLYSNRLPNVIGYTVWMTNNIESNLGPKSHLTNRNASFFVDQTLTPAAQQLMNDRLKGLKESVFTVEHFMPAKDCQIWRKREGYEVLQAIGISSKEASPEDITRCFLTTTMTGLGFSNVNAVYQAENSVTDENELTKKKDRWHIVLKKFPQVGLSALIPKTFDDVGKDALVGGETYCQVKQAWANSEKSRCTVINDKIKQGSEFDYPIAANDILAQRCKAWGIPLDTDHVKVKPH